MRSKCVSSISVHAKASSAEIGWCRQTETNFCNEYCFMHASFLLLAAGVGGHPLNVFWASVGGGGKTLAYSTAGRIPNRAADEESEKGLYRFSGQMFSKP